tara:strand:- start:580 stop:729 length:150 start_codon:yes stop_codon:yes gene_type:complete
MLSVILEHGGIRNRKNKNLEIEKENPPPVKEGGGSPPTSRGKLLPRRIS